MPISGLYWRYHPVRRTFEAYASGTSNSWGFDYNEPGDWFSETCAIPHCWHIIQGGYCLRQSNPLGHFNPCVYTNIETIADHLHYTGNNPHGGNNVRDARSSLHRRLVWLRFCQVGVIVLFHVRHDFVVCRWPGNQTDSPG